MIVGSGIDIIEIKRFKNAVEKWGDNFIKKIFTDREIEYSSNRRFSAQHFAARFAAKEAVFKAFGGDSNLRKWTDIEVLNDETGKPRIVFHESAKVLSETRKINNVIVSMSHSHTHAVANAILISERG
ncbi:MAG: holo-ACP synthase [Proteobacteria bacterium]|nr:holo-ACP synthase [Pseudomonadota bacterium]